MLNPFIYLINQIVTLINFALITWVILGLLIHFDILNRGNPLVSRVYDALSRLLEPLLRPIRRMLGKYLPDLGGVDLSPIVLILVLNFIVSALYSWFYTI